MRRRATASLLPVTALLALFAAACGARDPGWSEEAVARGQDGVQAIIINSQVAVGPTRLAIGLFDGEGSLIHDAAGTVRLFRLEGEEAAPAGEYDLRAVSIHELGSDGHQGHTHEPLATMYVASADLPQKDWWGAELDITAGGKQYDRLRTRFFVAEQSRVPAIGAPAPRTTQPVLRDVRDIAEIDSSNPPRPELHTLTVAEAIESKKPTLVAFATPAFCQTRFCGPVVEQVVAPLAKEYEGRANFVHIEPYQLSEARQGKLLPIPQMAEWGLASEPYLFVLDAQGNVAAQFEGITAEDEVADVLDRLLRG